MSLFSLAIAHLIAEPSQSADAGMELAAKPSDIAALHRHLYDHAERIGRALATAATPGLQATAIFDALTTELAQLGEPPKIDTVCQAGDFAS